MTAATLTWPHLWHAGRGGTAAGLAAINNTKVKESVVLGVAEFGSHMGAKDAGLLLGPPACNVGNPAKIALVVLLKRRLCSPTHLKYSQALGP